MAGRKGGDVAVYGVWFMCLEKSSKLEMSEAIMYYFEESKTCCTSCAVKM